MYSEWAAVAEMKSEKGQTFIAKLPCRKYLAGQDTLGKKRRAAFSQCTGRIKMDRWSFNGKVRKKQEEAAMKSKMGIRKKKITFLLCMVLMTGSSLSIMADGPAIYQVRKKDLFCNDSCFTPVDEIKDAAVALNGLTAEKKIVEAASAMEKVIEAGALQPMQAAFTGGEGSTQGSKGTGSFNARTGPARASDTMPAALYGGFLAVATLTGGLLLIRKKDDKNRQ